MDAASATCDSLLPLLWITSSNGSIQTAFSSRVFNNVSFCVTSHISDSNLLQQKGRRIHLWSQYAWVALNLASSTHCKTLNTQPCRHMRMMHVILHCKRCFTLLPTVMPTHKSREMAGAYLPLEMMTLPYCTRLYSSSRLNFPVTTPMDPVMVNASATILLAPIAM